MSSVLWGANGSGTTGSCSAGPQLALLEVISLAQGVGLRSRAEVSKSPPVLFLDAKLQPVGITLGELTVALGSRGAAFAAACSGERAALCRGSVAPSLPLS